MHGIGDQPEGDTLLAFGEPIVRWLRRWFASSASQQDRTTIEEVGASLHPSRDLRAEPAHAELRVRASGRDGEPVVQQWLMAESWWGGDVQRPLFGKLAFWMLTVGAWVVFSHFGKRRRWGAGAVAETKAVLVSLGVSLPIVLAFQLAVLALSILAVLPIPPLRKGLSALLLAMTGVLGDAFVLIENPVQRAALVERTRRSLHWLVERCQGVMVVAHSQGAAIAHRALRHAAPPNVQELVTFGSGLEKIGQIEFAQRRGYATSTALVAPLTAGLLVLFVIPAFGSVRLDGLAKLGLWMLFGAAVIAFVTLHVSVRTYWVHDSAVLVNALAKPLRHLTENRRWLDVFATHDPVPNGPLYREASPWAPVVADIVNRRDAFTDHTTYWDNDAEFLPIVVQCLERVAGVRVVEPADCPALEAAVARHRWCVRWLTVNRWAAGAGLAAAALFGRRLAGWGQATLDALDRIPLGVRPFAAAVVDLVDGLADWAAAGLGFTPRGAGLTALGFLLPLAVVGLLKMAFGPVWRLWARETVWRVVAARRLNSAAVSTDPPRAAVGRKLDAAFLVDAVVIGLAVSPLVAILAWRFSDPRVVLLALLWAGGGLALIAMGANLIGMAAVLKEKAGSLRTSRRWDFQAWFEILIVLTMPVATLLVILSFVPGVPPEVLEAFSFAIPMLIIVILTAACWSNLFRRFASLAGRVFTVAVPLLIGMALSAGVLLQSNESWAALAAVPFAGVLLGVGVVWLIAAIGGRIRRVRGGHASSPAAERPDSE